MTASTSHSALATGSAPPVPGTERGFVTGSVRLLLRVEGFAALAAALSVYWRNDFSWFAFALFFLAPDLAMLGYLAGPRAGAIAYNFAHTYVLPLALALFGLLGGAPLAAAGGLIWIAHIGFDRALGYGLKYPTAFSDTHLAGVGRH